MQSDSDISDSPIPNKKIKLEKRKYSEIKTCQKIKPKFRAISKIIFLCSKVRILNIPFEKQQKFPSIISKIKEKKFDLLHSLTNIYHPKTDKSDFPPASDFLDSSKYKNIMQNFEILINNLRNTFRIHQNEKKLLKIDKKFSDKRYLIMQNIDKKCRDETKRTIKPFRKNNFYSSSQKQKFFLCS